MNEQNNNTGRDFQQQLESLFLPELLVPPPPEPAPTEPSPSPQHEDQG